MKNKFKIVTILGSPQSAKSNTKAFVEDFIDEMKIAGIDAEHKVIPLSNYKVTPCIGCWNCTMNKPCPLDKKDNLAEIKEEMLSCDMLILASPVYTNQVTAQMKAFFDRLFTWCHIFPLLGKYSLSVVTTGNDGHKETAKFLEKMLATYGTYSFGSLMSIGAFISGFFPLRNFARNRNKKLAQKIVSTIKMGKKPKIKSIQKKMFSAMQTKMSKMHALNCMIHGKPGNQPAPSKFKLKIMKFFIKKMELSEEQLHTWSGFLPFELSWWRDRNWLKAKSFKDLEKIPVPANFNIEKRLIKKVKL